MAGYRFTVIRPIKGELRAGELVTIWRLGHRRDWEAQFPRPKRGEMFVFFLGRGAIRDGYYPAFGPNCAFQVMNGVVHSVSAKAHFRGVEGQKIDSFLGDLRDLSKRN
jgi:hypothetical protein